MVFSVLTARRSGVSGPFFNNPELHPKWVMEA